jgi:hypothetical protein
MAEIVNIVYNGNGVEAQDYSQKDKALITDNFINVSFGDPNDYIEYFIYDSNQTLLDKNYDAKEYYPNRTDNPVTNTYSSIALDPKADLSSRGYNRGSLNIQYNFLRNLFNSSYGNFYWIKEISASRREIKLASQTLSNIDIRNGFNQYQAFAAGLNYYNDFYLNFGDNQHLICINVAYTEDADGSYLVIKLYEPLPAEYDLKSQLWLVEKIAESVDYVVDIQVESVQVADQNTLRGPNFNVKVNQTIGQTTPYYNYGNLLTSNVTSSFQKMLSYYQDKAVQINVDYENLENFVHFSSATQRINNFAYKVSLIEDYNQQIATQLSLQGGTSNPHIAATVGALTSSINEIITNFDTYEYFLYFDSGSKFSWPKSNNTQPYSLYSVTSSQVSNWLGSDTIVPSNTGVSMLYSASLYDGLNKDNLVNAVPQYILDDDSNEPYLLFLNMVGQQFDNIWIYYKDVTNRYNSTNNPNTGISQDLVADALQSMGINLYTNTSISDNLYYSLFGINPDGSLLPPTGSEVINNYVTSSIDTLSGNDIQKEYYKRIYHNLPYLLKTKGTRNGIDALINIFGIPKSILSVNEFGGYDMYTKDGIDEINNDKIQIVTPLELSSSVLNPNVTLQYYQNNTRKNSRELEVGFSPADELNQTITGSLGFFSIDNLIGNPTYQSMSYYPALEQEKDNFFAGYNYSHSIYEYIRLIKYYNNSLFKMIKDYVPARAELSDGIIVKSHILERNKYERHEPEFNFENNYSQSVVMVTITGSDAPNLNYPTNYISSVPTVSGSVLVNNSFSWEKYTGEFSGSSIVATTNYFDQDELSSITYPWTSSVNGAVKMFTTYSLGALYQNVSGSVKSQFLLEADYNYNQNIPTNYNVLTSSFGCSTCARYRGLCKSYTVCNDEDYSSGNDLTFSYLDCNTGASVGPITVNAGTCANIGPICAREFSIQVNEPYAYTVYDNGSCGTYQSADPLIDCYSTFVSTGTGGSWEFNFLDCTGNSIKYTGIDDANFYLPYCIRSGSLSSTGSVNSVVYTATCGVYDPSTVYCTQYGFYATGGGGIESVTASLCNGSTIQFTPSPTIDQYYCIRSGSIQRTSTYVTWSLGSTCTYNPNQIQCINGVVAGNNLSRPINEKFTFSYKDCDGNTKSATAENLADAQSAEVCFLSGSITIGNPNYSSQYQVDNQSSCGIYNIPLACSGSNNAPYAEVQDYNYYRKSSVNARYDGSKVISAKYNKYTTGDQSYGNSPAINYYTNQLGVFVEVESSSFMPNQMLVKMPYLANLSGGLQELNLQNENWVDVQNVFKADSYATVKQFDATKYTNQKYLDRSRKVIESGYTYRPYYYRATSSLQTTECFATDLAETQGNLGNTFSELRSTVYAPVSSLISNTLGNYRTVITGSGTYDHFTSMYAIPMIINDTGNNLTEWNWDLGGGQSTSGSYYTVPQDGYYNFSANISFFNQDPNNNSSGNFKLEVINGDILYGFPEGTIIADETCSIAAGNANTAEININSSAYLSQGDKIFYKLTSDYVNPYSGTDSNGIQIQPFWYLRFDAIQVDATLCRDITVVGSEVFESNSITSNTISLKSGSGATNTYFTDASTYAPAYYDGSNSQSPLYETFGDIDYTMNPEVGDYFILYYNANDVNYSFNSALLPLKFRIINIDTDPTYGTKRFTVDSNFPNYITNSTVNNFQKIVFLKRIKDETAVIIEGRKRPGTTSYGFLIPEGTNPTIINNIGSLQASVQSQILSNQAGSDVGLIT